MTPATSTETEGSTARLSGEGAGGGTKVTAPLRDTSAHRRAFHLSLTQGWGRWTGSVGTFPYWERTSALHPGPSVLLPPAARPCSRAGTVPPRPRLPPAARGETFRTVTRQ